MKRKQKAEMDVSKPHNESKTIISLLRLTPAPHLAKRKLNASSNFRPTTLSPHLNWRDSWENHNDEDNVMNQLADAYGEIECLKSTLVTTNEMISCKEEEMKRLVATVAHFKAKSVSLQLKLTKENLARVEQMGKLEQLKTLLADSAKNQETQQSKIVSLEAEVNRLRASLSVVHPVAFDHSVNDSVGEMPMKKRRTMNHECLDCGYSTYKANAMKIHRQEGCHHAVKTKKFTCDVCKGEYTYNSLRYHLNQYTKQSNHAKNGHQNHSPAQHRQMLDKLKQTKQ